MAQGRHEDMDWGELDWLEEEPEPAPRRASSRREQPPQEEPPRRRVRDEMDWQEEPARRQESRQTRSGRQEYYDEPRQQPRRQQPRRQEYQEYDQPRPRRQQPRQREYYDGYDQPRPRRQQVRQEQVYPDGAQRRARQSRDRYDDRYDDRRRQYYDDPEPWRGRGDGGRGSSRQSLPLIILVVILVGGVLFAGGKLLSIMLDYRRDRSAYSELADQALSGMAEPDATPDPNAQQGSGDGEETQRPSTVNWEYLTSVNSDVIGWLYCPDTPINYPVVQTTDNDFYLHRGFTDKQQNVAGTLFADTVCTLGSNYNNFIIYGHNMKDGSMFASLQKYVDSSYYDQHQVMYYYTPERDYRVDLIAAHIVESTLTNYPFYFSGDGDYQGYLNDITSHSFFATHAPVSTQYQLITLSTCDYSGGYADPRFLVQGLLVPMDGQ